MNFLDVLGCFAAIPEEKLALVFEGLQREELLQVRGVRGWLPVAACILCTCMTGLAVVHVTASSSLHQTSVIPAWTDVAHTG